MTIEQGDIFAENTRESISFRLFELIVRQKNILEKEGKRC